MAKKPSEAQLAARENFKKMVAEKKAKSDAKKLKDAQKLVKSTAKPTKAKATKPKAAKKKSKK